MTNIEQVLTTTHDDLAVHLWRAFCSETDAALAGNPAKQAKFLEVAYAVDDVLQYVDLTARESKR